MSTRYCHLRTRNRATRALISVIDTQHRNSVFDRDGGRWVTVCETHGGLCNHRTLPLAKSWAREPWQYCERCAAIQAAKENALQHAGNGG